MTQEDKELLFQDLCARLPYHVRVKVWLKDGTSEEGKLDLEHNYGDVLRDAFYYNKIIEIKPYLRPMSSMTEEEKKEFNSLINSVEERCINAYGKGGYTLAFIEINDWLNAHHFDYRGLIECGLAIAVTEDNNPYKEK